MYYTYEFQEDINVQTIANFSSVSLPWIIILCVFFFPTLSYPTLCSSLSQMPLHQPSERVHRGLSCSLDIIALTVTFQERIREAKTAHSLGKRSVSFQTFFPAIIGDIHTHVISSFVVVVCSPLLGPFGMLAMSNSQVL